MQISKECRRFCKALGLTVVCVYGGTGISEQIAELKRGAEVIVCTPGRMIDMLAANGGKLARLIMLLLLLLHLLFMLNDLICGNKSKHKCALCHEFEYAVL